MHADAIIPDATGVSEWDSAWRSISTKPCRRPRHEPETMQRMQHLERLMLLEVERCLDTAGAELAIVSRAGSNLGKYRFDTESPDYTHSGFAIRHDGKWYVDHLLNWHESATGKLARHSLIDFFRDDPYAYRTGVLIPSPCLQKAIRESLHSPVREGIHSPEYSRLSYPFGTRYQNSNQWLAEIIGAAQSGETQRDAIQQYLRERGLKPSVLRLNVGLQVAAGIITDNTRLDDHPLRNRLQGRIEFLIEPSLRQYLQTSDPDCRVAHLFATNAQTQRRADTRYADTVNDARHGGLAA